MANGKKSVLLYCDIIHTVKKLTDEQAGKLFKHYLKYINDEDPKTDDVIIDLVFEPIKQNLKRDLKKWEKRADNSRENGKKGGRPLKEPKKPIGLLKNQVGFKKPVKDIVTVTETVNDILLKKETKRLYDTWIDYRKEIKKPIKSEKTKISLAKKIEKEGFEKSNLTINSSIENGYQGLFWDNYKNSNNFNTRYKKSKLSDMGSAVREKLKAYD